LVHKRRVQSFPHERKRPSESSIVPRTRLSCPRNDWVIGLIEKSTRCSVPSTDQSTMRWPLTIRAPNTTPPGACSSARHALGDLMRDAGRDQLRRVRTGRHRIITVPSSHNERKGIPWVAVASLMPARRAVCIGKVSLAPKQLYVGSSIKAIAYRARNASQFEIENGSICSQGALCCGRTYSDG
jgi:hypothetical protein